MYHVVRILGACTGCAVTVRDKKGELIGGTDRDNYPALEEVMIDGTRYDVEGEEQVVVLFFSKYYQSDDGLEGVLVTHDVSLPDDCVITIEED